MALFEEPSVSYTRPANFADRPRKTSRSRSDVQLHPVTRRRAIRKTQSLPVTPESDGFRFTGNTDEDGNHAELAVDSGPVNQLTENGEPASHGAVTPANRLSKRITTTTDKVRFTVPRKGVINLQNITSKDMSYMMNPAPVLSKSKTERFHKLFKSVPENEYPIDYFSCAFIGDILLQGNLYVSQNWFCFYSRIRGRGRLLEMPMEKVISITREKTAIIFPNAIGLQTAEEKYAFGSFISRDSTYRFLVSIWKKSQELKAAESFASAVEDVIPSSNENSDDASEDVIASKVVNQSHSKTDTTDQSDNSSCLQCDAADISDKETLTRSNVNKTSCKHRTHKQSRQESVIGNSRRKGPEWKGLKFPLSVIHCIDCGKTKTALFKSAVKLQRIPRTNLLLAICTLLVLFLLVSAVGLTYKILDLEAKLESHVVWTESSHDGLRDQSYSSVYDLHSAAQGSVAQHMQTVLKANIDVLEEIHTSLRDLHLSAKGSNKDEPACSTDDCA